MFVWHVHVASRLDGQYSSVDLYTSSQIKGCGIRHFVFLSTFAMFNIECNVLHALKRLPLFVVCYDVIAFGSLLVLEGHINHFACSSCMYNQLPFEEKSHVLLKSFSITCLLKELSFPYISDILTSQSVVCCLVLLWWSVISAVSRILLFSAVGKHFFSWYCSLDSRSDIDKKKWSSEWCWRLVLKTASQLGLENYL